MPPCVAEIVDDASTRLLSRAAQRGAHDIILMALDIMLIDARYATFTPLPRHVEDTLRIDI